MLRIFDWDRGSWDRFARTSGQYCAFSESLFLECSMREIRYFKCEDDGDLLGGLACEVFEGTIANMNHHPYGGIHFRDLSQTSLEAGQEIISSVSLCFAQYLFEKYDHVSMTFHWSIRDMRAFGDYQVFPRYTSLLDISYPSHTEGYARKRIRELSKGYGEGYKFTTQEIDDFALLNRLHELNFIRQGLVRSTDEGKVLNRICERVLKAGFGKLIATYVNEIPAVVSFFVYDRHRAYHLFVGTDLEYRELGVGTKNFHESAVLLNRHLGLKEMDLVGTNSPMRASYKLSYGGNLVPYFGIRKG